MARLEEAGVEHVAYSEVSVHFTDPDGARIELVADPLGVMYGTKVVCAWVPPAPSQAAVS